MTVKVEALRCELELDPEVVISNEGIDQILDLIEANDTLEISADGYVAEIDTEALKILVSEYVNQVIQDNLGLRVRLSNLTSAA